MLNTKLLTWALGIWSAITFIVCVVYGLVTPQSLHMHEFLELVLPAFKWLTWWGFLLGLAESFLYGVYAGLVFCPSRWAASCKKYARTSPISWPRPVVFISVNASNEPSENASRKFARRAVSARAFTI